MHNKIQFTFICNDCNSSYYRKIQTRNDIIYINASLVLKKIYSKNCFTIITKYLQNIGKGYKKTLTTDLQDTI